MTRSDATELHIAEVDPLDDDVRALVARHLAYAEGNTAPEDVYALDEGGLGDPSITVFGAEIGGRLLGIGALRQIDPTHGEIKSMHTAAEARRRGIAERLLRHLVDIGRARGYARLSLETGSTEPFAAARALYAKAGFVECGAFGDYEDKESSTFMALRLGPRRAESS